MARDDIPNKLLNDFKNLDMELGSDWAKANSKRYRELAALVGVVVPDYEEPPEHMDDDIIVGYAKDPPKQWKAPNGKFKKMDDR